MAHHQENYGTPQTDAFGNPVHHGITAGTHDVGIAPGAGLGGEYGHEKKELGGILRRSGSSSSSSSSSEDDGQGGRRKKGMKEKIKEKLPGHKDERPQATATTTPGGYHSADHPPEKKGMMEKIKEKLPGHN